jgi:hypothetical protein
VSDRARVAMLALAVAALGPACSAVTNARPDCGAADERPIFTLAAQAVSSATLLPCLDVLLPGWSFGGSEAIDGRFSFWLNSDRGGIRSVKVDLVAECDVADAVEVIPGADETGTRRFEEPLSLSPRFASDRFYTFAGGCIRVEYRFGVENGSILVLEADQAISFLPRQPIVDRLAEDNLVLCGAGAPPCPGGD